MNLNIEQETINKWAAKVESEMKSLLQSGGKVATGTLIESIKVVQSTSSDQISINLTMTDYGRNVISGRRAGAKMPPVSSIREWLSVKGIPQTAAFSIAKSISVKGIKPFDFTKPFYDGIPELTQELAIDFAAQTVKVITDNIKNTTVTLD